MQLNRFIFILFACTICILDSVAQPVIEILNDRDVHDIGKKIFVYLDESHRLSVKDILQEEKNKNFRISEQTILNIGITDAVLWCKFKLLNKTTQDCYLEISNTALDSISVYEVFSADSFAGKKSGVYLNFKNREIRNNNYLFRLCGQTGSAKTFYLRVRHCRGTQFSIQAGTLKGFSEINHRVDFIQGIYFGFMLLIIFYNLLVYFSVRDTSYLFYVLYVSVMTLMNASLGGYAFEYLWSDHARFSRYEDLISAFLGISGVLFARNFLHIKQNAPFMHKVFNVLIILFSAGIVLVLTGNFMAATVFIEIISLLLIIIFFIAAFTVLQSGYKPARFFLFAWSFLLFGVVVFVLTDFGIIPSNTLTVHSLQIGSAAEALLLSFALADRINIYKKEKEQAQLETLKQLGENEKLMVSQNVMLETKVKERTHELSIEKKTVEQQKEIVEEKSKEILDSITYAKRIQATILPPPEAVKKYLADSFVLYLPKDIVAGDFYWMEATKTRGILYFAVCDCTGHGVPGAMVSVVCHNALNRAIRELAICEPSQILNKVTELIVDAFSLNNASDDEIKDGMDASLCALNIHTGQLEWAGANNPLWIVKPNGGLIEYKADKQSVGKSYNPVSFSNHLIPLEKGDTLYLSTDGFADQFGGEMNKKFQRKALKELLVSINSHNMEQQREIIFSTFESWRGKNDQTDDVCIIGARF